jgi:hypothetical protein
MLRKAILSVGRRSIDHIDMERVGDTHRRGVHPIIQNRENLVRIMGNLVGVADMAAGMGADMAVAHEIEVTLAEESNLVGEVAVSVCSGS